MKYLKIINKKILSIIFHICLIICPVFIFYTVQSIIFNKKINTNKITSPKRELYSGLDNQKTEYICEKADNDLIALYEKETYDEDIIINISMKKSTSYLYKYLDDKNASNLKKYFMNFTLVIFLIILDILVVIIWIILCCILSRDKCLSSFKDKKHILCYKNVSWVITVIMYFTLILLNVIIVFHFFSFVHNIDNTFCSLFKITYHTYYGEEKNYEIKPKWLGILEIKNLLQNTKNQLSEIINDNKEIYQMLHNDIKNDFFLELNSKVFVNNNIKKFCDIAKFNIPNPNPLSDKKISNLFYCFDILNLIQKEYNNNLSQYILDIEDIYEIIQSIADNKAKIQFSLDNAKNKLDSFFKMLNDFEIEYFNTLFFIFEKIIHKYIIIIIYIYFFFIILIESIGFICILTNICCSNSNYCYKLYMFIWNIQMFSIIIMIVISAFFNFFYVIIGDVSTVIKYSLSKERAELNTTFSFSNKLYDNEELNVCIYGDGDLEQYTQLDEGAYPLSHFYSIIKIIKENLNYLINFKIFVEKNETEKIFDRLEEKPYLIEYQLKNNNIKENYLNNSIYTHPEEMLQKELIKYTYDEKNQLIGNLSYYSNYVFVYSKEFCNSYYNYNIIDIDDLKNDSNCSYQKGQNCMVLEDFPENNYFKDIKIKHIEDENEKNEDFFKNLYDLNNLTLEFKKRYYDIDKGFQSSVRRLLNHSKDYFDQEIAPKYNTIKNTMIKIYEILDNKINIINDLYEGVIGKNNTNLFSTFNCKYIKRDLYIFLNQLDINLYHSFFILSNYSLAISICGLICIIFSIFVLKLNKMINNNNYNNEIKNKNNDEDMNFSEKPKIGVTQQKYLYDDNLKSSFNEKEGFNNNNKNTNNNNKKPKNDNKKK